MQTSPSPAAIHRKNAGTSRRRRTDARKTAAGSPCVHPVGFLKHRIEPFITQRHRQLQHQQKVEASFRQSVKTLCNLYGFPMPNMENDGYPANLANAFTVLESELAAATEPVKLMVVQADNGKVHLTTYQALELGWTLYYIPVQPLWELMRNKQRPDITRLLLSVFSYLLKAGVPCYADGHSYLYDQYQMVEEWMLDAEYEQEYYKTQLEQAAKAKAAGDILLTRLKLDCHLTQFPYRLRNLNSTDPSDTEIARIATGFYELWQTYPHRSVFDSVESRVTELEEEEDEYEYTGQLYQQVSFIWSEFDDFDKQMIDNVNVTLQECSRFIEPVTFQHFDRPQDKVTLNLHFEKTLFDLINDLIYHLYRL
jgi:hypothetical protein